MGNGLVEKYGTVKQISAFACFLHEFRSTVPFGRLHVHTGAKIFRAKYSCLMVNKILDCNRS